MLAWDGHGHRAVSEAVQATLDPVTVKALATIAGTGDELPPGLLARLSMWPDEIPPLVNNPHTIVSGFSLPNCSRPRPSWPRIRTVRTGILSIFP